MTVALNTLNPFNGRLYSKEDPINCESIGRSETSTMLMLPFNSRSGCGVREEVCIIIIIIDLIELRKKNLLNLID